MHPFAAPAAIAQVLLAQAAQTGRRLVAGVKSGLPERRCDQPTQQGIQSAHAYHGFGFTPTVDRQYGLRLSGQPDGLRFIKTNAGNMQPAIADAL